VGPPLHTGQEIALSDIRGMYAFLDGNREAHRPDLTKSDPPDSVVQWDMWGGYPGLRWSRRILRRENLLKVSPEGDVVLPSSLELQLGPDVFAAVVEGDVDSVSSGMAKAGVPSACVPVGDNTLVLFSGEGHFTYIDEGLGKVFSAKSGTLHKVSVQDFPVTEVDFSGTILVDSSKSSVTDMVKSAGQEFSGFTCFLAAREQSLGSVRLGDVYLLKANDCPETVTKILKVDEELGLVLGWALVCNIGGQPYFDKQGHHATEPGMLEAATDFMLHSRVAGEMHEKAADTEKADERGTVVFCWPMTAEIAKAFDIDIPQTGLMIAMKPDSEDMLQKFKDGTYQGFSIGGSMIPAHTEEVEVNV